ncbi:MAG: arylsulfatase [Mariniphaga sp.]|nr:arylsulfatase [Mariniphaga sp.]
MKKQLLRLFLLLISILYLPGNLCANPGKPNVILIMTDDQGYGDFGVTGNNLIETPAINSFAAESVSFDRFYVSPVCAPTRATLLTGRYYLRTGVTGVTGGEETMNDEEVTLAEIFKSNGYTTGCFGKWHNGANYPYDPIGQGFDEFMGFTGGIIRNYFHTRLRHQTSIVQTEGYLTDLFTDKAIDFIEANRHKPFFCYIPYNVPHTPIQVHDELFEKYLKKGLNEYDAGIYAMCESVDQNVQKLLGKVKDLNLDKNTIILFLTDNGPNGNRFNGGMKGKKAQVDEGGIRVPLWIRWTGKLRPHRVSQLADHIDILPTVLDLCSIALPDSLIIDGKSLKPLLFDPLAEWPGRPLFSYFLGKGTVRDNRFRLTVDNKNKKSLYDMIADPSQLSDIAHQDPEKTNELFLLYQTWLNDVQPEKSAFREELGHPEQPIVDLPVTSAQLHGNLKFKNQFGYAFDWAVNWKSSSDSFSWDVQVVHDGMYEFFLQYLIPPGCEGIKIEVQANRKSLIKTVEESFVPEPYPNRDQVDRGRSPEMKWENFSWGSLSLQKGAYTITVKALEIPGPQAGEFYGLRIKNRIAIDE